MQHVDLYLAQRDLLNLTQWFGPPAKSVIATRGSQQCDRAQRSQHMRAANIARVIVMRCVPRK